MARAPAPSRASAWPLLLRAYTRLVERVEADLAAAGLPELTWYDVLWTLAQAPGHRLRLHELASAIVLSRSNLTRLTDRLEEAGYLARERAEADRRGYFAVITPDGLAMRKKMWQVYSRSIDTHFDRHLTASEQETLRSIMTRLLDAAGD